MTPKSSELYFIFWSEVDPITLDPLTRPRESETFSENAQGIKVLRIPTSKCSNFATNGSYSYRFHSRDNGDLYLTNISQILKIHEDFRVICRHKRDITPRMSEVSELCGGSENRIHMFRYAWETAETIITQIWKINLNG